MKQYYISFLYEKNGLRKIAAGFMKPTGKVTREEIELWMDKIKEELGLEQKIVILNVFELENGHPKACCMSTQGILSVEVRVV